MHSKLALPRQQRSKKNIAADESFTVGSLSSVFLTPADNRSVSDDECSYSYSYSYSVDSVVESIHGGTPLLGALPPSNQRFPSISPVKKREDNDTLDIPGCSDWSFDISRMSVPALTVESGGDERGDEAEDTIAQDANTTTFRVIAATSREDSPTTTNESSQTQSTDSEIAITFGAHLESLALRLASLEKAIYRSDNDTLPTTGDFGDQNVAFIVEEEDSTVESLTNGIVLSAEIGNDDARNGRRRTKHSLFARFFFFGGCRKI